MTLCLALKANQIPPLRAHSPQLHPNQSQMMSNKQHVPEIRGSRFDVITGYLYSDSFLPAMF